MVRLKGDVVTAIVLRTRMFQFHNGSIKGKAKPTTIGTNDGFNSTMVRLKVDQKAFDLGMKGTFQFHNGSIKGIAEVGNGNVDYEFQFHNGSIKG